MHLLAQAAVAIHHAALSSPLLLASWVPQVSPQPELSHAIGLFLLVRLAWRSEDDIAS